MTKCIGCRSCEIACNEQNGNPAEIHWRRFGEIEGGTWPDTQRSYLSMGCNHCLDAECVKGCPVEAYTKDPATGIVLHSAEACIGCQYCVWNCPYSVPQFNPERGVVGKCDMCHGRLEDGLEPACVNACPESAIEIEIVNMAEWRKDYAGAESPGMPAAGVTISTTRITLPESGAHQLERVDLGHIQPEHAHLSLVLMTTLMQAVSGALIFELLDKTISATTLIALLLIASVALTVSAMHLGRPVYAWRALKMWRRSWISREVLLYSLFFAALGAPHGTVDCRESSCIASAQLHRCTSGNAFALASGNPSGDWLDGGDSRSWRHSVQRVYLFGPGASRLEYDPHAAGFPAHHCAARLAAGKRASSGRRLGGGAGLCAFTLFSSSGVAVFESTRFSFRRLSGF